MTDYFERIPAAIARGKELIAEHVDARAGTEFANKWDLVRHANFAITKIEVALAERLWDVTDKRWAKEDWTTISPALIAFCETVERWSHD